MHLCLDMMKINFGEKMSETIYMTKSHLMSYDYCPYKYKRTVIDKLHQPTTPQMTDGTEKHSAHDNCVLAIDLKKVPESFEDKIDYVRQYLPETDDIIYDSIAFHEAEKLDLMQGDLSLFKPKIVETTYDKTISIGDDYVAMRGRPDHIYLEADGTYNIFELKTGQWKDYMKSKIRKELSFYYILLEDQLDAPVEHISWFYPRVDYFDMEKIKKQSIKAAYKSIEKLVNAIKEDNFPATFHHAKCSSCFLLEECIFGR